ncbi:MAG: peptide chain release factor N(5)-glutamine methyltransferase [Clostridia bacterium]|nr:peptide chain release factor N(5)-glutamine methyltransferase [Clostridia bacterium]
MTVKELLTEGKSILEKHNIENCSNEARWIFESVFECKSDYIVFHSDDIADSTKATEYLQKTKNRASGVPVQYVIGKWDFYGEEFFVGEGVLIPRPETELLVDFAVDYLKEKKNPVVFDLCAGSGCIGLTVARLVPDSKVFLIEKSDDAMKYLVSNKNKFNLKNVVIISGDIFNGFDSFQIPEPDLILSNPPYINSDEILSLQSEVLKEPVMALDGGIDGLNFYKVIADKWIKSCNSSIAVECGEGQAESIKKLFSFHCSEIFSISDFNGIERVVVGRKDIK